MVQQQTETGDPESRGAFWNEADRVQEFVERQDRAAAAMAEIFSIITSMIPHEREDPIRVLDIGSGYGPLAAAVLDAFPKATAVGLDLSEAMIDVGNERMARFGDRFSYFFGDFSSGALPAGLEGPFDAIVSSRAIHHLPSPDKQRFFADIRDHLADGGCFFNLDNTRTGDEVFRQNYRRARGLIGDPRGGGNRAAGEPRPEPRPEPSGMEQREFQDPMEDQLAWLRAAGFAHVECPWKRFDFSIMGAYK